MLSLTESQKRKAIAYYRHSAEDKQENSVLIQREHTHKFAVEHDLEIIHEEADEGKSGLLAERPGFEKLFSNWILKTDAPQFDFVLVYDVSRWGRFQDQNEAAYYEFRCKQQGKKVIYVSRGFPKEEHQLISNLQTSIERYMAAEYSRQLSDKVFYGCVKVSEQGYSAGGTACYGMTRLLLDVDKKPIRTLKKGEHKQIANERVTFTPSNDQTTEAVKQIFASVVEQWQTPKQIAENLNQEKIPSANGREWNQDKVFRILTNETYTGSRIYNKTWGRLKQKSRPNPRNEWVICPDAFEAIVRPEVFGKAQEHLYWLYPAKWQNGIRAIRRLKRLVLKEVTLLLNEQGLMIEQVKMITDELPIVFGVNFYCNSSMHRCFSIEEKMRKYKFALAATIDLDNRETIHDFFMIPTNNFDIDNVLIMSGNDSLSNEHRIEKSKIKESLSSLCGEVIATIQDEKSYQPTLSPS